MILGMVNRPPNRKCYGQFCPLATALDVVGDRWTLLLLRELLGGPARFHQLEMGLPGIAKNLLATRLRQLEADDIVRRVSSDGVTRYALTATGESIRTALEQLAFWGSQLTRVGPAKHKRSVRAIAMALSAILGRAGGALPTEDATIELLVDADPIDITLGPSPTAIARPSTSPQATVRASGATMADYLAGKSAGRTFAMSPATAA